MYLFKRRFILLMILIILIIILIIHLNKKRETILINSNSQFSLEDRNNARWKELENRFHKINFSLLVNPSLNDSKTIKYQCTSVCGGLGDRLRGLIMSYFFSLLLNRQLVIDMNWPCKFDNYFEYNKYKWISSSNYTFNGSWFYISAIDHNKILVNELEKTFFIDKWSKYDNIQISTNMDFLSILFSNIYLKSNPIIKMFVDNMSEGEANIQTLFPLFFEILLKPKEEIRNLIDQLMINRSNEELICTHLRIGKNPSNPRDHQFDYSSKITKEFIHFISKNQFLEKSSSRSLFISSDSINSIQQIENSFPNRSFSIPGPILQIDLPADGIDCNQGFIKVVSDFYLLSECQIIILTNSGFSAFANRRRQDPYLNLYKYNSKQNIIQRCLDLRSPQGWEPPQSASRKLYCPVINTINFTIEHI